MSEVLYVSRYTSPGRFRFTETKANLFCQGAAAVLEFYAIEVPLAQPRNAIGGQLVSTLAGVAVAKLFQLSDNFHDIQYLGGALACACATCLMAITKTVHPPAGATALLAVVDDRLVHIGWFLIPVMMLGCGLMCAVALIINNIQRRFPIYWWTPEDLRKGKSIFRTRKSVENEVEAAQAQPEKPETNGDATDSNRTEDQEATAEEKAIEHHHHDMNEVIIRPGQVVAPETMYLTQEEKLFLETLCKRL